MNPNIVVSVFYDIIKQAVGSQTCIDVIQRVCAYRHSGIISNLKANQNKSENE